jgi:type I restriction enzyme S subunit
MSGRKATTDIRPGQFALSVGNPQTVTPVGWSWVALNKVAKMATGHTPSRRKPEYYGGDIPWVSVKDARPYHGRVIHSTAENINELGIKNSAAVLLPAGTVCLSRTGSIGYSVILGKQMATSQGFVNWICSGSLHPRFLQLLFVVESSFLHTIAEGVAHTTIYFPEAKAFHICMPSYEEQMVIVKKIEELFSELDKGIQNLKITQQQIGVYLQTVFKAAFEGKLTSDNLKESELPKNWKKTYLGNVVNKMKVKASPENLPDAKFIGMDCIKPHSLKPHFVYRFNQFKSAGNYFKKDQVLYGRMRPYLNKVYKAEYEGVCSGEFIVLECKCNFLPDLLKYILHSREFVSFANHKTAGDRPRISYDEIADYPILLCSVEEQMKIVQAIETRLTICNKIQDIIASSLSQAEALQKSILKKAFEGKLLQNVPESTDQPMIGDIDNKTHAQRKVLAGKIIYSYQTGGYIGRTKLQKLQYLCEYHAQLDIDTNYIKEAAGPLDKNFLYSFINEAKEKNWIEETPIDNGYKYEPGNAIGALNLEYPKYFRDKSEKISFVIKLLRDKSTDEAELIATIYAIWNNCIIVGKDLHQPLLVKEVYEWSKSKVKFSETTITEMWRWMKGVGLIPIGFGKIIN